jgi:DNA-binding SARP family transcriptional activator
MSRVPLRLELLGPPRIEAGRIPLRVDTRKAVGLLAYLACGERRHGRDELAALLWPDGDEAHARAALRRTLSVLNRALAAAGAGQVVADRAVLELPESGVDLDVVRFRRLVRSCDVHGHAPDRGCPVCIEPLTVAVGLHRGDFMAGFALRDAPDFEAWQLAQVGALRRELAGALQRLAEAHAVEARWDPAIATTERWLALDPLQEPAHRQLIRLYAWSGQRSAAIRQYRRCVRLLDTELGVAPLAATTAVYQEMIEDRLEPPPAPTAGIAEESRDVRVPPSGAAVELPLVGRERQWATLADSWAAVQSTGRGRLISVVGEVGIGKTRLVEEFVRHVAGAGAHVVRCRCYDGERLAYAPLIDPLRAAIADPVGGSAVRTLEPEWLIEASRLLPELASLVPAGTVDASKGPGAPARFLEGLCRAVLAVLAGRRSGVLVLDDAHWADESTLELVGYLARRLSRAPLLLMVSWCKDDAARGHPLRRLMAEAQQAGSVALVELNRLDCASVAELVGRISADEAVSANEVFQWSEGLPLLVAGYVTGRHADPAQPAPALPVGARELFLARLEQVPESAWQVLTTAAVLGRSFNLDTVRAASGRSDDEFTEAVDDLVGRGLIREMPESGPTFYDFSHEQLRVLVYEAAGLARRRLLHRRVAMALAGPTEAPRRGPGRSALAHAASIAQHFQRGGMDAEAATWYARAGERAAALFATAEAIAHNQAALALGHPDPVRLHTAIGDLHVLMGEYDAALLAYQTAAAQVSGTELAALEHKLGGLRHRFGDWHAADAHFSAAAALLGQDGSPAARARLYADWSITVERRGDSERARALAQEALGLAGEGGDAQALAQAHNMLGVIARHRGDGALAREHLERSLAVAETLPDPSARIAALNNLALASAVGDLDRALSLSRTALTACLAQGDRHRAAAIHSNLADLLHAAGRREEAMEHLKEATTIFSQIGAPTDDPQPEIWKLVEW